MPDEFGSFLDMNLEDTPELSTVPGNKEYQLKVSSAEMRESGGDKTAGQKYILVRFRIIGEPDTKSVFHNLWLPSEEEDEEMNNLRKRNWIAFLESLGWDISQGFNYEELEGQTCWAVLNEEDDPQWGKSNRVVRFLAPQEEE